MANSVTLTLPTPLLFMGAAGVSNNITGAVAMALPAPVMSGVVSLVSDVVFSLPTPTLLATGNVPNVGRVQMVLPAPLITSVGRVGASGDIAMAIPAPTLSAASGSNAALRWPIPTLLARGATGRLAQVALTAPVLSLNAFGVAGNDRVAAANMALPVYSLAIQGTNGSVGRLALSLPATLRKLGFAAAGSQSIVGWAELRLPIVDLRARAWAPILGIAALQIPTLRILATGVAGEPADAPDGVVVPAIVLNTETNALSHYLNYAFNSFAMFGGMELAASAEGLFAIGGGTDNGALIDAALRVGETDFSTSFQKRIMDCYIGYRADGDLVLRAITDESCERDYSVRTRGDMNLHGTRVRLGKGVDARYWQFEIRNVDGSDFELNAIEVKPTKLRRRFGWRDA